MSRMNMKLKPIANSGILNRFMLAKTNSRLWPTVSERGSMYWPVTYLQGAAQGAACEALRIAKASLLLLATSRLLRT